MKYDYGLKPLKFWCQKVLPLVYDESLSYEELLCKVVAYLNDVIEGFNGIPEYIQSLVSDERLEEILGELLDELREQIARINEGENTNASKDRTTGELLWLDGKLAKMTRDILAGDKYIEETDEEGVTGNYVYTSVEIELNLAKDELTSLIGNLSELDTTSKTNLVSAINEVLTKFVNTSGDLSSLTTTDKSNLVNAINEVLSRLVNTSGVLSELNTTDKSNLVNAINEVLSSLVTTVGSLSNLNTTNKNNVVSAVNEVNNKVDDITLSIPNITDFGVIGDGNTDNTTALNTLDAGIYYVPNGSYLYSNTVELDNIILIGESVDGVVFENNASNTTQEIQLTDSALYNITFNDNSTIVNNSAVIRLLGTNSIVSKCKINLSNEGHIGISVNTKGLIDNCVINGNETAMFGVYASVNTTSVKVTNSEIYDFWLNGIYSESKKLVVDNSHLHDNHHQETPTGGGQICVTGESAGVTTYTISNCFIAEPAGNSTYAIETFNATGTISSNLLQGNSTAPTIRVQQSANDCIIGNAIMGGRAGIEVVGGATRKASTLIEGNTFASTSVCVYCGELVDGVVAIGNNTNGIRFYDGNNFKAFLNYQTNGSTLISNANSNVATIEIPFDITRLGGGVMVDLTVYCNGQYYPVLGRLTNTGFVPFISSQDISVVLSSGTLTITGTGTYIEVWYRFY